MKKAAARIEYVEYLNQSSSKVSKANVLFIRPAEFLEGFWNQTPPLNLTQNLTAYQFLGPYDIILPRPESFKVGRFKANLR